MSFDLVVVGVSMGGLDALTVLLGGLPPDFPLPIAVVQHRGTSDESSLGATLQRRCRLTVCEPHDKEPLRAGRVYVGPPDYHLLIDRGRLALSTEGRVQHARPSIDVLFESAAATYGEGVIGVVLTGASVDGASGAARIKARGGLLVVEDPATASSPTMPSAALAAAEADQVLPLGQIAGFLLELT